MDINTESFNLVNDHSSRLRRWPRLGDGALWGYHHIERLRARSERRSQSCGCSPIPYSRRASRNQLSRLCTRENCRCDRTSLHPPSSLFYSLRYIPIHLIPITILSVIRQQVSTSSPSTPPRTTYLSPPQPPFPPVKPPSAHLPAQSHQHYPTHSSSCPAPFQSRTYRRMNILVVCS